MALTKEMKEGIIKEHSSKDGDTGSVEVQVAILTEEITELTRHGKEHAHDFHSKRGLLIKVGKRKRLLTYLKKKAPKRYLALIKTLKLRK